MKILQVLTATLTAAIIMSILAGGVRATQGSGTMSSVVGPPALFAPFQVNRHPDKHPSTPWGVVVEAMRGLTIATQTITFAVNAQSGWHSHPGPVFISVKEGTMTFYEEDCTRTVRTAGEGFLDTGSHPHLAVNESGAPATNVVTYFAPPGTSAAELRIDEPRPLTCQL